MTERTSRIWQVTSLRPWGGRESVPVGIHEEFLRRGIPAALFCSHASAIAERFGHRPGVVPLRFSGLLNRAAWRPLRDQFSRDSPSAILCHYSHDLPLLRLLQARTPDTRLYLVKHVGPGRPKKDPWHRWVYRRVNGVFAVSEYLARRCRQSYPIAAARVAVWHPGIDLGRFRFRADDRARLRHQLGLAEADILVGYVARLTPGKGHEELIEAFVSLAEKSPRLWLAIVGSPSPEERSFADRLRAVAGASSCARRIIWTGFVEDVPRWLWACDVFVNPSPAEAFGLNTVEAMAASRPVIGTSGGGTPDIITPEEDGLLVEPGRPRQLAEALHRLIADPPLRDRLSERACATAGRRFDVTVAVDSLLRLIDRSECVGRRTSG